MFIASLSSSSSLSSYTRLAPPPTQAKPAFQAVSASPAVRHTQRTGIILPKRLQRYGQITANQLEQELLALNLSVDPEKITWFANVYALNGGKVLKALQKAKLPNLEFGGRSGITLKRRVPGIDPQKLETLSHANEKSFAEFKIRNSPHSDVLWLKTRLPKPTLRNPKPILQKRAIWQSAGFDERSLSYMVRHFFHFSFECPYFIKYPPITADERGNLLDQAIALNNL
jgi:hypothetical protein